MNIDELTVGQLKEIAAMLGMKTKPAPHPFVGQYVLCRCYSAGVHTGWFESMDGDSVILRDSRRLWSWGAVEGVALSGVAQTGLAAGCKVDRVNPKIALTGVIEVIPMSNLAMRSVDEYK